MRFQAAATSILLLLGACGGDAEPAWAELGQGEANHTALADGDAVSVVVGPQGGTMIALSLGAGGLLAGDPEDPTDPDNPRVTFQAFLAEDVERVDPLGSITVVRGLEEGEGGILELTGTWLVFDPARDPAVWIEEPLLVGVRIRDASGREAADSATVTALWAAGPPGMFGR